MSGLKVEFKGRHGVARAVDGVDFAMNSGEIVALVGESGCGKTTLARSIMGLQRPLAGEIRVRGEALRYNRRALREHRRTAQMIFQDPTGALNARQTIYEAVAEGVRIQKLPGNEEELVAEGLSRAGLRPPEQFFTRYPYEISGGQRQRVIIAGAMVLSPSLLVADEPVSSLDASIRGEILALMLKLVRETHVGILVVTHDLGLAWNVANRVAVMYLGRIVEEGPTEEILSEPRHPYTRALLSVVPEIEQMDQQILTGEAPDPTRIPAGLPLPPALPAGRVGAGGHAWASRSAAAARIRSSCRPATRCDEHPPDVHERSARRRERRGVRGPAGGGARRRRGAAAASGRWRRADRWASRSSASTPPVTARWPAARTTRRRRWSRARWTRPGQPRSAWRNTPYAERCERMRAVAAGIGERHFELAAVVSLETGKSRTESILEVQEAVDLITTYADLMESNEGYVRPLDSFVEDERNADVLRPYGVFAVISPFNFPAALSINMAGAALIAGNTVVFKPSEETPWTGAILGQIARSAELPAGVLNVVQGGPATGRALVEAAVDGVAFTGSAEVGRWIARTLQEGPYARPALTEMGGKNPAIVTAAADLDKAAEGVARAAFGLSGQKCSACSRAIVVDAVHDEFVERLAAEAGRLKVGDPAERDMFLGPVVNEAERGALRGRGGERARATAGSPRAASAPTGRAGSWSRRSCRACLRVTRSSATSCSCRSSRSPASARSTRRWPRPTPPSTGSPRASTRRTRPRRSASSTRSRRAWST